MRKTSERRNLETRQSGLSCTSHRKRKTEMYARASTPTKSVPEKHSNGEKSRISKARKFILAKHT